MWPSILSFSSPTVLLYLRPCAIELAFGLMQLLLRVQTFNLRANPWPEPIYLLGNIRSKHSEYVSGSMVRAGLALKRYKEVVYENSNDSRGLQSSSG